MSNTNNKPLTAEEIIQLCCEGRITIRQCAEQYAAQQTAALREELAATEKMMVKYKSDLDRSNAERLRQAQLLQTYKDRSENMEAVKKERDGLKMQRVKDADDFLTVLQQRDEAVTFLQNLPSAWRNDKMNEFLARLSSGETKPDTGANLASQLKKAMPETYPGKAYQPLFDHMSKEHNLTLLESEMQEIIEIMRKMDSPWISVKDRLPEMGQPVLIVGDQHIDAATFDTDGEGSDPKFWVEKSTYMIGITYWMPLPAPPESLTDKK